MERRLPGLHLREALPSDADALWEIWQAVVEPGTTYAYAPGQGRRAAERHWIQPLPPARTYVAERAETIVGTYVLKPNQPGLGNHVANAGFMVAPHARRQGVGRALGEHALEEARRLGYQAMQFNFVVASNRGALALWYSLGFTRIGTVPDAFRHAVEGLTDVHILHRPL